MEMIKLTINGKEVTGKKGDTILTIAAQNGIEIPNLCYNKNLKIYGSCGLCVVEAEKSPKLLRACATVAADGMVIHTHSPRAQQARKIALALQHLRRFAVAICSSVSAPPMMYPIGASASTRRIVSSVVTLKHVNAYVPGRRIDFAAAVSFLQ